jgi:uncharacterized RDD family membrane protein YckC
MTGQNPYEPPKADVNAGLLPQQLDLLPTAGMGARFLNFLVDSIISRVLLAAAIIPLAKLIGPGDAAPFVVMLLGLGAMAGYYVVLETVFGWTLGKLITGTRVVRSDGDKPSLPQVLGRTLMRFVPFEPLSVLFSSSNRGWHDSASGTRVVRVRR